MAADWGGESCALNLAGTNAAPQTLQKGAVARRWLWAHPRHPGVPHVVYGGEEVPPPPRPPRPPLRCEPPPRACRGWYQLSQLFLLQSDHPMCATHDGATPRLGPNWLYAARRPRPQRRTLVRQRQYDVTLLSQNGYGLLIWFAAGADAAAVAAADVVVIGDVMFGVVPQTSVDGSL